MVTGVSDLNTAFEYRPYICAAQQPPPSLIPSHQSLVTSHSFRTAKNIRGMPSAFTQMQAGHGIGAGVVKCSEVRTSWLSSVLGLAGSREAWKGWISRIFFVCLTCSALDRWGKKTDISLSCPMSLSAKQDLPFVRPLSVIFLSANEFWKSENSREKVHTRCPWLHICIVYLIDENCKSRLISNSQVMGDSGKLSSDKRIYIGSSAVCEHFYSHGGLCRDKEMLTDQSVRGRFLFLLRK